MIRQSTTRLALNGLQFVRTCAIAPRNFSTDQPQQNPKSHATDKYLHYSAEEGYYKTSPFDPVSVLDVPLDKYVWRNFKKWENHVATVDVVTGHQYTFAELRDASAALAVRLQMKFRLAKNDVLAICLPNLPEYPAAVLGAIEAGLIVTTVNPIYTADEIARQLIFSDAKAIIGAVSCYATLAEACRLAKKSLPIVCVRMRPSDTLPTGSIDFAELISSSHVDYSELIQYEVDANDLVILPFSSGTTGMPKGVMLSHNNITTNCEQIQIALPSDLGCGQQEVAPAVLPFFHIYGLTVVMISQLGLGSKLVTLPQFKPEDLVKALSKYKGTILNLVPPIALYMSNHHKVTRESAPVLRYTMSGAAPIGIDDVERFKRKFPKTKFLQGYGMTEASPVVLLTPVTNTRYASTGFPTSSTEAKVVAYDSDDLKGVGPNQNGELCVRGPQVMKGYLNNEEANRETFYPGGWLRTGDVAHYDEDGYFYITDRMKELIKVKGFQVPPAELEAVLRNHPKILEAAVFGVPHKRSGEVPRAVVVLRPGMEATEEEIFTFAAKRVAHYKKLEGGVVFVDEVPKNSTGKILRKALKEQYSS